MIGRNGDTSRVVRLWLRVCKVWLSILPDGKQYAVATLYEVLMKPNLRLSEVNQYFRDVVVTGETSPFEIHDTNLAFQEVFGYVAVWVCVPKLHIYHVYQVTPGA